MAGEATNIVQVKQPTLSRFSTRHQQRRLASRGDRGGAGWWSVHGVRIQGAELHFGGGTAPPRPHS